MKKPGTYSDTDGNSSLSRDNLLEVAVIRDMDDFLFEFPGLVYTIFIVNAC